MATSLRLDMQVAALCNLMDARWSEIGVGLGGVRISAWDGANTFGTETWAAGGYSLRLASGAYDVLFEGRGLDRSVTRTRPPSAAATLEDPPLPAEEEEADLPLAGRHPLSARRTSSAWGPPRAPSA